MAKQPKIRFKGFTEEWKRDEAHNFFYTFCEKNHPELPVLAATQEKGMVIRDVVGYQIAHNRSNEVTYKRVLPGQFVVHLRSFQGGFAHSNVEGITSPAYEVFGLKDSEMQDDYYWKYIFCSKAFIKRLEKVTYGIRDGRSISYPEFLELPFSFPSKAEQKAISTFITKLTTTISRRETELEKLKNIKRALLEKLFPQEGLTTPAIRFKGFEGEWEKKRLKDIAIRVTRKNTGLKSTIPLCISAQLGLVDQTEYYNNVVVGANMENYFLIQKGEFAYNKSAASEYPMGAVKCLENLEQGILSTLYIVFALKPDINEEYIKAHYETKPWQDDVKKRVAVGARNHGLLNISPDDFFDSLVVIPSIKEEQRKVGKVLAKLDSLLSLRERQLTLLKHTKQALLEQMFVNE